MLADATVMTRSTAALAASAAYHHRQLDAYVGTLYDFNHQIFTSLPLNDMLFQLSKLGSDTAAHVVNFNDAQIAKRVGRLHTEAESVKTAQLLAAVKREGAEAYQQTQIEAEEQRQRALMAEMAVLFPAQYGHLSAGAAAGAAAPHPSRTPLSFGGATAATANPQKPRPPAVNNLLSPTDAANVAAAAHMYDAYDELPASPSFLAGPSNNAAAFASTAAPTQQQHASPPHGIATGSSSGGLSQVKSEAIDYREMEQLYREQQQSGYMNSHHDDYSALEEEELMIGDGPGGYGDEDPYGDDDPEAFMMQMMMGMGGGGGGGGGNNASSKAPSAPPVAAAVATRRVLTFVEEPALVAGTAPGGITTTFASSDSQLPQGTLGSTQEATLRLEDEEEELVVG